MTKPNSASRATHGGKGDAPRKGDDPQAYRDNYNAIFRRESTASAGKGKQGA